jgi:AcrR family transcriptional regulator
MPENLELKRKIIETAGRRFLKYGFTKTSTDEIAADLAISKKTLYKHFSSKKQLLELFVESMLEKTEKFFQTVHADKQSHYLDKIKLILKYVSDLLSGIDPKFALDLKKKAPELWEKIHNFRGEKIAENLGSVITQGQKEGIFRLDVDKEVLVLIFTNTVQSTMIPQVFASYPYSAGQLFEAVIKTLMEGILTDEGRKRFVNITQP